LILCTVPISLCSRRALFTCNLCVCTFQWSWCCDLLITTIVHTCFITLCYSYEDNMCIICTQSNHSSSPGLDSHPPKVLSYKLQPFRNLYALVIVKPPLLHHSYIQLLTCLKIIFSRLKCYPPPSFSSPATLTIH